MFTCPECGYKSSKVEIRTTEIGTVKWLNPTFNKDGTLNLGDIWEYEGGETWKGMGYQILCIKCGEVIKEVDDC